METNDIHTPPPLISRERMPELVATIGATLVALAVGGFLASSWETISQTQKSMILGAGAVGLTLAGVWADRDGRRLFDAVVGTSWATATLLTAAAVTLAASTAWPGYGRATIAAGGVAAAAHAGMLWRRRPESVTQQVALFLAAVFAAGPFGTALSDRFEWGDLLALGAPLVGLSDPTYESDAFLLTGLAHLGIGALWLGLAHLVRTPGFANAARAIGTVTVGFAALELNVLTSPVGAVAALAVVIGYLLYGVWSGESVLIVIGGIGALVAGARVLAALFSGQVTVTLLVFAGGLTMIAWAFRQSRRRREGGEA